MIERYSRKEMKDIWEDYNKYSIWLDIELAAAEAMEKLKIIPKGVVKKVRSRSPSLLSKSIILRNNKIIYIRKINPTNIKNYKFVEGQVLDNSKQKGTLIKTRDNAVWLKSISYNKKNGGYGTYLLKMSPKAKSLPHEHKGYEEFLILDGELIDHDGKIFKKGNFISFEPGSKHSSWTKDGCLILVFMRGINQAI